jgi:Fe-Mn family superoxide dismutase
MCLHHGKHHKAYVDKLNELVRETEFSGMELQDVVRASFKKPKCESIFNNAAQAWNHTFFWSCLRPRAARPNGSILQALERDLGGYEKFKEEFVKQGTAQFGSGWVWLVADHGTLTIEKTHDAVTPITEGKTCVLTIDVWEHAYYLDYQNRRTDFLKAATEKLLNWDFAAENFERAA